jgi:hypothetical protein
MFLIHTTDDGRIPGFEYLPAAAITPKVGMALVANSGNLAVATGTTQPTYISMADRDSAVATGDLIPVVRVQPDMIFEVPLSAAGTSLKVGQKVTIATDGLQVTATTTDGVAEIVEILGTAAGDKVRVRFA